MYVIHTVRCICSISGDASQSQISPLSSSSTATTNLIISEWRGTCITHGCSPISRDWPKCMSSDSCRLCCRIFIRTLVGLNVLVVVCNAFRREKNKTDYKLIKRELGPSRSYIPEIKLPSLKMSVNDECLFVCLFWRVKCT